jgi:hypothetical protein
MGKQPHRGLDLGTAEDGPTRLLPVPKTVHRTVWDSKSKSRLSPYVHRRAGCPWAAVFQVEPQRKSSHSRTSAALRAQAQGSGHDWPLGSPGPRGSVMNRRPLPRHRSDLPSWSQALPGTRDADAPLSVANLAPRSLSARSDRCALETRAKPQRRGAGGRPVVCRDTRRAGRLSHPCKPASSSWSGLHPHGGAGGGPARPRTLVERVAPLRPRSRAQRATAPTPAKRSLASNLTAHATDSDQYPLPAPECRGEGDAKGGPAPAARRGPP